jgi:homoserine O-acetyltransferase/O-succinyltransferase
VASCSQSLALNHLQRQAILLDPRCRNGSSSQDAPVAGLALARAIATCSYKSAELFAERFDRRRNRNGEDPLRSLDERFDIAGYLDYQGEKFTRRFNANSYLILAKAMDTFDLTGESKSEEVLNRIRARVLLVGILSDWLFPKSDVQALAERMRAAGVDSSYAELRSSHGHDGFLADALLLEPLIKPLLDSSFPAERYISVGHAVGCL